MAVMQKKIKIKLKDDILQILYFQMLENRISLAGRFFNVAIQPDLKGEFVSV